MKKSKIFIRFLIMIMMLFAFSISSSARVYSNTQSNGKNKGVFDEFVSSIEGKSKDLSKIELYVGGMPFGVKIISKGLTVVGFSSTEGDNASPAFKAGMRNGDIIIKVNGSEIKSINDFASIISSKPGEMVTVTVLRGKNELDFSFKPMYSSDDGSYKTGIFVKDSTSGIGTVTFINPVTGAFGGLGHGICDSSSGRLVSLSKGIIMDVSINGVVKGKVGDAGELRGSFNAKKIGSLSRNSSNGVFGVISLGSICSPEGKMHICPKEEIKSGEAYIWCTLDESGPQKYSVSISDIDLTSSSVKNFRVKVTDPRLLLKTGGIVQGMSGSPIIQDGRIIGAVTHVCVNQ